MVQGSVLVTWFGPASRNDLGECFAQHRVSLVSRPVSGVRVAASVRRWALSALSRSDRPSPGHSRRKRQRAATTTANPSRAS